MTAKGNKVAFAFAILGLLTGFGLQRMGFSDYAELHKLFTFADFRLLFTFMGACMLAMAAFFITARGQLVTHRPYHPGTIAGGVCFGIGWALCGACPSIALVHLGEGKIPAIATAVGILVGILIFKRLKPRFFRFDTGTCG